MYPTFPFVRVLYILAYQCGYGGCISHFSQLDEETKICIAVLYIEGLVFGALALYLNQIVPQTYGVPKHPFFLCRDYKCKRGRQTSQIDLEDYDDVE